MDNTEISQFGISLKYCRELNDNMSQRALGKALGVSGGSISHYENGKQPTLELAQKAADFFDLTLDEFLNIVDKNTNQELVEKAKLKSRYKQDIKQAGDKAGDKAGDIYTKSDNTSHKEGNSYEIEALRKSLEDKERIIASLEQRITDKEELNKMLRNEVDRLKKELQGYKSSE
ncbi:helix-turn-helix domain-containing protein [Bernardetia sp. ABR2-2B]|uniref:helix-turn-helix domain-containing protein n=1 Tax=Bernardetia sp. ABR2-2B TaxID=3127472 RepID=UPI0030CE451E